MWSDLDLDKLAKEQWLPVEPRTREETEKIVVSVRLELYNKGVPCGPEPIRKNMKEYWFVTPLPSTSTIARMLAHNGLTHGRTGWYNGEGPALREKQERSGSERTIR